MRSADYISTELNGALICDEIKDPYATNHVVQRRCLPSVEWCFEVFSDPDEEGPPH